MQMESTLQPHRHQEPMDFGCSDGLAEMVDDMHPWVMWAATPGGMSWSSSRSSCAQAPVEFDHAAVNGKNKCKYCLKGGQIDRYQSHGTGQERNTKGTVK